MDSTTFDKKDVAEYYDTTQNHYEKWWNLKDNLSLHYGIWDERTHSFADALRNTNQLMLKAARIKSDDCVLDAGCGVGGAAFFIHNQTEASVTGITLSNKQLSLANQIKRNKKIGDAVSFQLMDFCNTSFKDETFDVVWACESVCHAEDKNLFINEVFRILKKGGRLVLCDFFLHNPAAANDKHIIEWQKTWGVPNFTTTESLANYIRESGFAEVSTNDYTSAIHKSAKRMYHAALLGAIPSITYNLLHPGVPRFAKTHYKCGIYQYKALKKGLWEYQMIVATK